MRVALVHQFTHAALVLEAGKNARLPLILQSPPGAASYAGTAYFAALMRQARMHVPGAQARFILDCADDRAAFFSALRLGFRELRATGDADILTRLGAIATESGAQLHQDTPETLDILDLPQPERRIAEWFFVEPVR